MKRLEKCVEILKPLRDDEDGTSLTEFVIALPIFLIIFSGVMTLGHLGVSNVAVKKAAYAGMWENTKVQTTDNPLAMTPRSKLDNPLQQIGEEIGGSAIGNILDGIPFWTPNIQIPGASGAGPNPAIGIGGHWGEAEYYASTASAVTNNQVNHRTENSYLAQVPAANSANTKFIIGDAARSKTRLALDDNLASNGAFDGFNISDIWAGADGLSDIFGNIAGITSEGVGDLIYDGLSGSGLAPGLMAGVRYGRGIGAATNEVELRYPIIDTAVSHSAVYMTAPSPNPDGRFNTEGWHWLFYVGASQPHVNQRELLNVVSQDLEEDGGLGSASNPQKYR